ncbi:MAG: FecR family protein [Bdellovibrionota bacterium]
MRGTLVALVVLFSFSTGRAAAADGFGVVKFIQGKAVVGVRALKSGDKVELNDVVTTGPKSFVRILLREGVAMNVGPDSTIHLSRLEGGEATTIDLLKGFLLSRIKKSVPAPEKVKYQVRTRTASLGVRGTTFFAKEEPDGRTFLCVCEGTVEARWAGGSKTITSKHHDTPLLISSLKSAPDAAEMGHDHDDAEIAALDKLLN